MKQTIYSQKKCSRENFLFMQRMFFQKRKKNRETLIKGEIFSISILSRARSFELFMSHQERAHMSKHVFLLFTLSQKFLRSTWMREIVSTALGIGRNNNEENFSLKSSQRTKEKSFENHRCSVIVLVFRDSVAFSCFIRVVVVAHKKKKEICKNFNKLKNNIN